MKIRRSFLACAEWQSSNEVNRCCLDVVDPSLSIQLFPPGQERVSRRQRKIQQRVVDSSPKCLEGATAFQPGFAGFRIAPAIIYQDCPKFAGHVGCLGNRWLTRSLSHHGPAGINSRSLPSHPSPCPKPTLADQRDVGSLTSGPAVRGAQHCFAMARGPRQSSYGQNGFFRLDGTFFEK